jgi:hypothetical protein
MVLLVLVTARPLVHGCARAQEVPWPCEVFLDPGLQSRCLADHQAAAESALASFGRAAAERARPALDSLAAAEAGMARYWRDQPPGARALIQARFRLTVLRHFVTRYLSQRDTGLHFITPIEARFRPDGAGHGLLAFITNYTSDGLLPHMELYSPLRDERRANPINVLQGRTKPFGWREGWQFEPGDIIEAHYPGYYPQLIIVH